jgi:hypothetical protein
MRQQTSALVALGLASALILGIAGSSAETAAGEPVATAPGPSPKPMPLPQPSEMDAQVARPAPSPAPGARPLPRQTPATWARSSAEIGAS